MNAPIDQPQRERFITEHDRNFSVVASAGSGKTRAITDRILAIARSSQALERLPALLVVTYTNRAASEMQQRARQSLLEAGLPLEVLAAFGRAFFGTIHSLCLRLLAQHGHHLGLPSRLDLVEDDEALWQKFVQQQSEVGAGLSAALREALLRLVPGRALLELGRKMPARELPEAPGDFPAFDFTEVYDFIPERKVSIPTAQRTQAALRQWETSWTAGEFAPLPKKCECAPLEDLWLDALTPLREWRRSASLFAAAGVARKFREFRLAEGAIDYADQVALAAELLRSPDAARAIRAKNYRVLLDEAQDTDPTQFDVLLDLARPADESPPRAGHFCMVGDFQQSIYGERADLAHYRRIHDSLIADTAGEALKFSVTFRLDAAPLAMVDATFPHVLHGSDGQVEFVKLEPRPSVLPGQVILCELGELPDLTDWNDARKSWLEAERLAAWLRTQDLSALRVQKWSEVAILCPRKGWFAALRTTLRAQGFAVQIQSERDVKGDSPAYAWFTALAVILAEPRSGYEIAGVLREVFGLSDRDLAAFAEGKGERLQIVTPGSGDGPVAETLTLLAELRARIETQPLFSAMQEMAAATRLRERLLSLPAEQFEQLSAEFDDLLTLAASAEAAEATLATFAAELRTGCTQIREVRSTTQDAIQLITGHKAKGSEWPAVIVPFFAREVRGFTEKYPRIVRDPREKALSAAFDAGDLDDALKLVASQEAERLLYVSLTRARHTLVIVDDRELFMRKKELPKNCGARWLQCGAGEKNEAAFGALPTQATACPATRAEQVERSLRQTEATAPMTLPPLAAGAELLARERATAFLKRNPSALAEAALAEADPAAYFETFRRNAGPPNAGQLYGTWWHEFVEQLDWSAGAEAWEALFAQALPKSPDAPRSLREWKLLNAQMTNSDLGRLLTGPRTIAHAEMPFLWAMSAGECLDGIMDLAVFDPTTGAWLILDWKTNHTSVEDLPKLRAHYLPQLSAYWQAVGKMLGAPVTAGIYSTTTGRWLPYETDELAASWEKLRSAPAELERVLGGDEGGAA